MSNNVVPFVAPTSVSTKFAQLPQDDGLSAGIQGGYGVMGYKGKVWTAKYKGEERPLMRSDGDGPRNSIDVVILKAPQGISKMWYEKGYVEGSSAPPDCWSSNGTHPAAAAPKKQNSVCATCPKNEFGTRISADGKGKGKACSDSKRLAIVPANVGQEDADMLRNELWGGPMLLRVPAASLQDLAKYGERLRAQGYPYQAVITKISFNPQEAYPKFMFEHLRPLFDSEADVVIELSKGYQVDRVAAEDVGSLPALPAPVQQTQQVQPASPSPAVAPPVTVAPPPAAAPVVTSAVTASPQISLPADIEAQLDNLIGG